LQILSILKQYKASATFFVVGKMAEKYPDLIRAIHRGGHVVGNHTYHHVNLTKIPVKEIIVEWEACNEVIQSITGKRPQYARPPGGDYDRRVMDAAKRAGLTFVLWTENVGDYLRPSPQKIESTLIRNASNGDIFLLHDGVPETLHALPFLLSQLKRKGFTLVNMDQMRKVPH
jgi:peptidoglycan/xylan/chitin deacetylase (PgdA/CDA1 family)